MILLPEPAHMVRPFYVGLRGAAITMFAFLAYFWMTGVTLQEHQSRPWPYLASLGLAFLLHYIGARAAIDMHRRRQRGEKTDA